MTLHVYDVTLCVCEEPVECNAVAYALPPLVPSQAPGIALSYGTGDAFSTVSMAINNSDSWLPVRTSYAARIAATSSSIFTSPAVRGSKYNRATASFSRRPAFCSHSAHPICSLNLGAPVTRTLRSSASTLPRPMCTLATCTLQTLMSFELAPQSTTNTCEL